MTHRLMALALAVSTPLRDALDARAASRGDRGDVPGWVLITIMTAGLVVGLWTVAGPALERLFTSAVDSVTDPT